MQALIVAPDLTPPWTEGRKTLVRDLASCLGDRWSMSLLSTRIGDAGRPDPGLSAEYAPSSSKALQYPALHSALKHRLRQADRPDVVLHFPFGTFSGLRGVANRYSVRRVDAICATHDVPCITVLYSMTHGNLERLASRVRTLVAGAGPDWKGPVLNVGIDLGRFPTVWQGRRDRRLLFMAGYSENRADLLEAILKERGLAQLTRAGNALAQLGCSLTIAIPLLRHDARRRELESLLKAQAPLLPVRLVSDAKPVDLFAHHDLYLFPYRMNYTRFMPTSLLEAMACGIPVVASRLPMLEPVVQAQDRYCLSYAADDDAGMVACVRRALEQWEETCSRAQTARRYMETDWTIESSAEQLERIVSSVLRNASAGLTHV